MDYLKVLGPYKRKDGRSHVVVKLQTGEYKTISYPKFLVEKKLGRKLKLSEEIHHIDGDFRNNQLTNLSVLSCSTHAAGHSSRPEKWIKFECPTCNKIIQKDYHDIKHNWSKGKSGPFCSRECAGKFPSFVGKSKIVEVSKSLTEEIPVSEPS